MTMKKTPKAKRDADILPEYDFSKGVRGKFAKRFATETNVIALAPDVAAVFPDSQAVNEALRTLMRLNGKKQAAS
jgi:hypothetical protein